MSRISVIGSINMDIVVVADKKPASGETVFGKDFFINPGGKGANQAVAAARLGAEVTMFGCVGDDLYGEMLIEKLSNENIDVNNIWKISTAGSGVASIVLAEEDNSIIVVPGANSLVNREYIDRIADLLIESDIVLTQLEIPLETVLYLSAVCREKEKPLILNPAPALSLPRTLIENSTYITPNEKEAGLIFTEHSSINGMLEKYPDKLIVTMGKAGAGFYSLDKFNIIPAMSVEVTDTTGAGDTFNGAFACAVSRGEDLYSAVSFANAAAGLSVIKKGAQSGMPTLEEVKKVL